MPRCDVCQLNGRKRIGGQVFPADLCIVGESPGKEELLQGLPFVGPSGRLLNYMLKNYLGLERSEVAVINALECELPQELKGKVTLYRPILEACRDALVEKLRQIRPKWVLVLGEIATKQVRGKSASFKKLRGSYEFLEEFNCYVFYTYHPSVVLRYGGIGAKTNHFWTIFEKDFIALNDLITGKASFTTESYYEFYRGTLSDTGIVTAIDCEWKNKNELICVGIGGKKGKVYMITPEILKDSIFKERLNTSLEKRILVFANRPSDERILKWYGIKPTGVLKVDVFNMANLVNENIDISLENLAEVYLPDERKIKSVLGGKKVEQASLEEVYRYNSVDVRATRKLFFVLLKKIKEDSKVYRYWESFILPCEDMLADICSRGFRIDMEKLNENESFVVEREKELELELLSEMPKKIRDKYKDDLKLTKTHLLLDFLYLDRNGLKLKPVLYTATGQPSISEDALIHYKEHPWIQKFFTYKKVNKLVTTYFNGIRKNLYPDGRIYPNIVLWATVTGRTACMNPNLQQIPRSLMYVEKLKELFEAPIGWVMGARDLSQSEIRIMGWLAQDVRILEALAKKEDIHRLTASIITSKRPEEVTKEERQAAKAVNFGFLYGAQASTFRDYAFNEYGLVFSQEEAEKFREKFFDFYNAIPVFHRKCERIVREYKQIRSPLGRLRRFPNIDNADAKTENRIYRQAINFPIQSFSSDLTLIGMYLFWEKIRDRDDVRLLWMIHDSVFFIAKEEVFGEMMALLKYCLEEESVKYIFKNFKVKVGYPVESEGKAGPNWANMKDWKD